MKRKLVLVLATIMIIFVLSICGLSVLMQPSRTVSTPTPTKMAVPVDPPGDAVEEILSMVDQEPAPTYTSYPTHTPYPVTPTSEPVDTPSDEEHVYMAEVATIGEDIIVAFLEINTWASLAGDDTSYLLNSDWLAAMTESCMKLIDCYKRASELSSPSPRFDGIHNAWLGALEKYADAANLIIEGNHEVDAGKLARANELLVEGGVLMDLALTMINNLPR